MAQLKVGDVVQLKTGGPKMTVTDIYRDTRDGARAECKWFVERGMSNRDVVFNVQTQGAPPPQTEWVGPCEATFGVYALDVVAK